jgi:hypothetical protein
MITFLKLLASLHDYFLKLTYSQTQPFPRVSLRSPLPPPPTDGDHNSPRPRFMFDSACVFLSNCLMLDPAVSGLPIEVRVPNPDEQNVTNQSKCFCAARFAHLSLRSPPPPGRHEPLLPSLVPSWSNDNEGLLWLRLWVWRQRTESQAPYAIN